MTRSQMVLRGILGFLGGGLVRVFGPNMVTGWLTRLRMRVTGWSAEVLEPSEIQASGSRVPVVTVRGDSEPELSRRIQRVCRVRGRRLYGREADREARVLLGIRRIGDQEPVVTISGCSRVVTGRIRIRLASEEGTG